MLFVVNRTGSGTCEFFLMPDVLCIPSRSRLALQIGQTLRHRQLLILPAYLAPCWKK